MTDEYTVVFDCANGYCWELSNVTVCSYLSGTHLYNKVGERNKEPHFTLFQINSQFINLSLDYSFDA